MTESVVVYSKASDSMIAGRELSSKVVEAMPGGPPDALVLFAAPQYDHSAMLGAIVAGCKPRLLVGASSAGEFVSGTRGEGMCCALALRSKEMAFSAGIGRQLGVDRRVAAKGVASSFRGISASAHPFRSALVLTDALAGHTDDFIDELTLATSGKYEFFGGGAGDNAQFRRTPVFFGTEVVTDAVVALEILSSKPLGIGVGHGWERASAAMRVTEASGVRLVSLNGTAAVEVFLKHAEATHQTLDLSSPIPFFLNNILGIDTGNGDKLRVPLAILEDGSVSCAADIPTGAVVHIMRTTAESATDAAVRATKAAMEGLKGNKPKVALFFDCVATRLRLGDAFGFELQALTDNLGKSPETSFLGCNTHGQIARAEGQFGGFHNCTAVVCVLPE